MIESLIKGWNIFKKKSYFVYALIISIIYLIYSFFTQGFIIEKINKITTSVIDISGYNTIEYIINILGWNILLFIAIWFFAIFILNYLMYIIALSESKIKRKNIFDGISKVLSYSSIIALVLIVFGIIMSILLSFQNIFIFILLGLLALCFIAVSFIFTFGIIQLGLLNKSINDSFYYAWKLIKKRFWTIIGFMILLYVELYLLYLLIDWLYFIIFFYNETASIIIQILIIIIYLLYSINTLTIFTSKKNKKIGIK